MGRTETSRTLEWDSGQIQDYAGSDLGWGVNWYNTQQFWSSMCNNFCVPGESPSIRKLLVEHEKRKTTADSSTPLRYGRDDSVWGEAPECLLSLIAVLDGIKMQTSGRVFWLGSNFFVGVCSRQLGQVTYLSPG